MTKWKQESYAKNSQYIRAFCTKWGLELELLNNGYQQRINGLMDVYPVRQKWHWLPTGERGEFESMDHLRNIMLKRTRELKASSDTVSGNTHYIVKTQAKKPLLKRILNKIWRR